MNRHRDHWSVMGSSMFEFENNLDKRQLERERILKEFTEKLVYNYKDLVKEYADKSDTVSIDGSGWLRIMEIQEQSIKL